jgi:hypothetical protein
VIRSFGFNLDAVGLTLATLGSRKEEPQAKIRIRLLRFVPKTGLQQRKSGGKSSA